MSGEFTSTSLPLLAGAYFDFATTPQPAVTVNPNGIVGLPFTHNWGPANQIVSMTSMGDFLNFYGQGTSGAPYTPGFIAVQQAFDGEGLPGRGGASEVLGYRIVGSGGAVGTLVLQNTTPATGITLSSKYKGSWASNISVTVGPAPVGSNTEIQVYVQGLLAETWVFPNTSLITGVNAINAGSVWITAVLGTDGVALMTVASPTPLAGGNDGATVAGADITAMEAAFGTAVFSVFAPWDLSGATYSGGATAASMLASIAAWGGQGAGGLNQIGHRAEFVTGGALGENATTATTRATTLQDPNFITIGVGSYDDSLLGVLSTSQLAPRLAGIIAARGSSKGLTFARLARLSITAGAAYADIVTGIESGFMTIGQDSNPLAPVRFEKGVTTWTSTSNASMPVSVFGNPKFMLTMQQIERDITTWAQSNVIGIFPVDAATISYVIGYVSTYLGVLASSNIIQPGWTVSQAISPAPSPTDQFIALTYGITFDRDVEQILNTVVVQ